ncbi:MAG TPA: DapH/DapD/GlmU-related protein [Acholeplasmataceae bacterium]|nr:DapH/DapD/GlmU-related protein [Acholeplasmataceae bacterium]HRX44690.1 DapH/DapD/GlmU-related protein [Acholeplasmataceae bacterium]
MMKCTVEDVRAVKKFDPAASNCFMIYFTYPGVIALRRHRRAHKLWNKGFLNLARIISYRTRRITGIDIHPAAQIGHGVFIDHGMGTVIGETAVIGDNCVLYHGVTLGANTFEKVDRHPKLGNNVIVYANATLIGPIHIGDHSIVAAGAVVVKDAPPYSKLIGIPAHRNSSV